jgi:hypothetical protein
MCGKRRLRLPLLAAVLLLAVSFLAGAQTLAHASPSRHPGGSPRRRRRRLRATSMTESSTMVR